MLPESRALAQIIRLTGGYPAGSPLAEVHAVADAALRQREALADLPWRTGRSLGRTVYARTGGDDWKADTVIGKFDTPELAEAACAAHNALLAPQAEKEPRGSLISGSGPAPEEAWRRRLRGFHVEGLPGAEEDDAGRLEICCCHCGVVTVLGDGRDAVLAVEIADWCMQHVCPGLRVT